MRKNYLMFLIVIGLITLSVYSTYALFTQTVETEDIVNFTSTLLEVDSNIIEYERITINTNESKTIKFTVTNNTQTDRYYGIWYEMVKPVTINYKIIIAEHIDSREETSGSLTVSESKEVIIIIENHTSSPVIMNIGVAYSDTSNLELPTDRYLITGKYVKANPPELTEGMVPVEYLTTSDGVETDGWYVADETATDWYNYAEQRWANAVLVTDASGIRTAPSGTLIVDADILAHYVWIPRYKYQLFNAGKKYLFDDIDGRPSDEIADDNDYYDAEYLGVNIVFENETETTGTVSCTISSIGEETCQNAIDGAWYTHPAFWWDSNDNRVRETSEELTGIWVGKFELSSETPDAEYGGGNTTDLSVRIKPNVYSWRYNNVSNFSTVIQNMMASENIYGINNNETDSHMIKNIEWGAVAYFTHSKYGRCIDDNCSDINLCNSVIEENQYKTGVDYINNLSMSSTSNVTGIYDLDLGLTEYVMGNMIHEDGADMISGDSENDNSGFKGMLANYNDDYQYNWSIKTSGAEYPSKRYYDVYRYSIFGIRHRGFLSDATGEITKSIIYSLDYADLWHDAGGNFVQPESPWVRRGGKSLECYYSDNIFTLRNGSGNYSLDYTTRAVLIALPNNN